MDKNKKDDPEESKRFVDMAKQLESDEDPKRFDKSFIEIAKSDQKERKNGS